MIELKVLPWLSPIGAASGSHEELGVFNIERRLSTRCSGKLCCFVSFAFWNITGVVEGVVRNAREVVAKELLVEVDVAEVGILCSGVCNLSSIITSNGV